MGLLGMLLGTDTTLGEQDIASDVLKDSKFSIIALAKAVTETTNPELKAIMINQLLTTIDQHHQLSDLVASRDWFKPFSTPQQQANIDINAAKGVTS